MHFRPGDLPQGDPTADNTPVEWEDNPLSNTLAFLSHKLTPRWCQSPDHWTAKISQYLFTDCPCCLLFRGLVLGSAATLLVTLPITLTLLIAWLLRH